MNAYAKINSLVMFYINRYLKLFFRCLLTTQNVSIYWEQCKQMLSRSRCIFLQCISVKVWCLVFKEILLFIQISNKIACRLIEKIG